MPVDYYAQADSAVQKEGNDFATQVLGDAWDMNEFSDIGTYLNNSNQAQYLTNVSVANGVFSATSVGSDPQFTALFPGYLGAMSVGKVGANYPINSSKYQCLHVAMNTVSTKPDFWEVYYFADNYLNGGTWGTTPIFIDKEYGWNVYSVNLASPNNTYGGNTRWADFPYWQGLRIDPSVRSASFSVDWIRLTDCNPVDFRLSNLPTSTSLTLYVAHDGREIRVSSPVQTTTGSYTFDLQGIEPGSYTYLVRNDNGSTVASGNLEINQSPVAEFVNPSGWTGQDYSETLSAPWDMESPNSVSDVKCSNSQFGNGLLNLTTKSVESLPSSCISGGYADPQIYLTSLSQVNSAQYRYLNFKMKADGNWEDIPNGMIVRFIWTVPGSRPGYECHMVSEDIPFGVGENTYTIDLYDAYNGQIVEKAGDCTSATTSWLNSGTVIGFRFDPNENQLGRTLNQQIDWIRLSKQPNVQIGNKFSISLNLNKSLDALQSWRFFYTTTPSQPMQHSAAVSLSSSSGETIIDLPPANFTAFLPVISSSPAFNYDESTGDLTFIWNTNGVSAGEYFLCGEFNDGLNSNIYCSSVPVILY
ncbi:MAG: hypothetical protein JW908_10365 [Anaerolineales bacterium]|nr:hypothetical protein [Anaerolineales bacterium]